MKTKELTLSNKSDLSALEYLAILFSGAPGYIQLVAIRENSPPRVKTVSVNDIELLEPFVQRCITDEYNIYYQVNPVRDKIERKATKEEILCCWNAHVDIDPAPPQDEAPTPEHWKIQKEQLLEQVQNAQSSFIIDSGGGIQLILKLQPSVELPSPSDNADVWKETVADCESINCQLIAKHGGDIGTQDISRLMRLPGTINFPNKRKRLLGRARVPTRVVYDSRVTFDPARLKRAPRTSSDPLLGSVRSFKQVADELAISRKLRNILVSGEGSDDYKSRSEALFAVACGLARSGVSVHRGTMLLLNAPSVVGEKAREKGQDWMEKQYQRAWSFVIPGYVDRFNSRNFVVTTGGKTFVVEEEALQTPDAFQSAFMSLPGYRSAHSEVVKVGETQTGRSIVKPIATAQLDHPQRRSHTSIVLAPSEPPITKNNAYNLWRGFGVEPNTTGSWDLLEELVYDVICRKNDDDFEYLMSWAARCVQYPDKQAEVALVLRGDRGVGKGTFLRALCDLFHPHSYHTANSRVLTNDFNGQLVNVLFLFLDEAFWAGAHSAESAIKAYITEPKIELHPKFQAAYMTTNRLKIAIASNSDWVVPAGSLERRFFVLDVSNDLHGKFEFFEQLNTQLNNGGYGRLLQDLLEYDIGDFNVRSVPSTAGLIGQQIQSADPLEKWIFSCLELGKWTDREHSSTFGVWSEVGLEEGGSRQVFLPSNKQPDSFLGPFPKSFLHEEFLLAYSSAHARYSSIVVFGRKLNQILPSTFGRARGEPWISKKGSRESSQRDAGEAYRFADIAMARRNYLDYMGWIEWPIAGDSMDQAVASD